jgi:S-adenosylmethionine:tRNA ribosyltransferase-isomerase
MKTSDFDYYLPEELIAQTPLEPRDSSRLLVFDIDKKIAEHRIFRDLTEYLREGDVLVVNNTRVMPARLFGILNEATKAEVLLLKRLNYNSYEVVMRPARRARTGSVIRFSDKLSAEVKGFKDGGVRLLEFSFDGVLENLLDELGETPLPPYIKQKLSDKTRYQTVYCKTDGSAAAPTAGLHFTTELLEMLKKRGVTVAEVLLHVGLGTFRPVNAENLDEHKMHGEYYEIPKESAELINAAKREGRRVIAVGTTSVRTLESAAVRRGNGRNFDENNGGKEGNYVLEAGSGDTDIFIYPPYKFKIVDALITNFHLPKSSLIMLVSAFAGYENTMELYRTAVDEKYRFFSLGDAMFIYNSYSQFNLK